MTGNMMGSLVLSFESLQFVQELKPLVLRHVPRLSRSRASKLSNQSADHRWVLDFAIALRHRVHQFRVGHGARGCGFDRFFTPILTYLI